MIYVLEILQKFFVPETPLLNISEAKPVADPKIAAFERAGEEYAGKLCLAPETIESLQSLMISKEEYIRNIG